MNYGERVAATVLRNYRDALERSAGVTLHEAQHLAAPEFARSHRVYLGLLHGLLPAFPGVDAQAVPALAVATYGTYRMLLEVDTLVDETDTSVLPALLQHHHVVVDALTDVFGREGPRREWMARWQVQWNAIQNERRMTASDACDEATYRRLAVDKSGMVSLPVDWLDRLAPQPQRALLLRQALQAMHVGMQWVDDLRDFEDDTRRGQRTLARERCASLLAEQGMSVADVTPDLAKRMLFASGAAELLIDAATTELRCARAYAHEAGCPSLVDVVDTMLLRADEFARAVVSQRLAAIRRVGMTAVAIETRL